MVNGADGGDLVIYDDGDDAVSGLALWPVPHMHNRKTTSIMRHVEAFSSPSRHYYHYTKWVTDMRH